MARNIKRTPSIVVQIARWKGMSVTKLAELAGVSETNLHMRTARNTGHSEKIRFVMSLCNRLGLDYIVSPNPWHFEEGRPVMQTEDGFYVQFFDFTIDDNDGDATGTGTTD